MVMTDGIVERRIVNPAGKVSELPTNRQFANSDSRLGFSSTINPDEVKGLDVLDGEDLYSFSYKFKNRYAGRGIVGSLLGALNLSSLIAAGTLLTGSVNANAAERLQVSSRMGPNGVILNLNHSTNSLATDGFDLGIDSVYSKPPFNPAWGPKIYTSPNNLSTDVRSTNSTSIFKGNIEVINDTSSAVSGTNALVFSFFNGGQYTGIDTNKNYLFKGNFNSPYLNDGTNFVLSVPNVIANNSGIINLPNLVNVPARSTNLLGTFEYATPVKGTNYLSAQKDLPLPLDLTSNLVSGLSFSSPDLRLVVNNGTNATFTSSDVGIQNFQVSVNNPYNGNPLMTNFYSINVTNASNSAPTLLGQTNWMPKGVEFTGQIIGTDGNGDGLTYRITSGGENLTSFDTNTGVYTFTGNHSGNIATNMFSAVANDGKLDSLPADFYLISTNNLPVGNYHQFTLPAGHPYTNLITASDANFDGLSFSVATQANSGLVSMLNQASNTSVYFKYVPSEGFKGNDTFYFNANDGVGEGIGRVDLSVTNTPPVAIAGLYNFANKVQGSGQARGSDYNFDNFTFKVVNAPTNAQAFNMNTNTGEFTYTPRTLGTDRIGFVVNDGSIDSGLEEIVINSTNTPPTLAEQNMVSVSKRIPYSGQITGAFDFNGDAIVYNLVAQPTNALSFSFNTNSGAFSYTSKAVGMDRFTLKVRDEFGYSSIFVKQMVLMSTNNAPIASDFNLNVNKNMSNQFNFAVSDINGDSLQIVNVSQPGKGYVFVDGTNGVFTPFINLWGPDSFSYAVVDSDGATSQVANVSVNILRDNRAPTLVSPLEISTIEGRSVTNNLVGNDLDGDAISFYAGGATNGSVVLNGSALVYNPNPGFFGNDSVNVQVADDISTNSYVVPVVVERFWDAPILAGQTNTMRKNSTLEGVLSAVSPDTTNNVNYALHSIDNAQATFNLNFTNGSYVFTPPVGFAGNINAQAFAWYTNQNVGRTSELANLKWIVTNSAPLITGPASINALESEPSTNLVSAIDEDGDSLSLRIARQGTNGTANVNGMNLIYSPAPGVYGQDSIRVSVNDGMATNEFDIPVTISQTFFPPVVYERTISLPKNYFVDGVLYGYSPNEFPNKFGLMSLSNTNAQMSLNSDTGEFRFVSPRGFTGEVVAPYYAWNENLYGVKRTSEVANAYFKITNNAPIVTGYSRSIPNNVPFNGIMNMFDANGDSPLTARVADAPTNAVLNLNSNGTFTYTPQGLGIDGFSVIANDGQDDSKKAWFNFDSYNIPPYAEGGEFMMGQGTTRGLWLYAEDGNNDKLSANLVSAPLKGSVAFDGTNVIYTPNPDAVGKDSFVYSLSDGYTNTPASVSVDILERGTLRLEKASNLSHRLIYSGTPGQSYTTFESKDLKNWKPYSTNIPASDGLFKLENIPNAESYQFFKAKEN